jgi:hypothetical protein
MIAVPVGLWYVVLNNHNQIHAWQTYRSVVIVFGAIAAFTVAAADADDADVLGTPSTSSRRRLGSAPPDPGCL